MKRIVALIMVALLLFSTVSTASAASFRFLDGKRTSSFSSGSAKLALKGTGKTGAVFFVTTTKNNAKVTLKQTKGTCAMLNLFSFVDGLDGKAKAWGKYTVTIYHGEKGCFWTEKWDDTYFNETYTVKFPKKGHYFITVTPFTEAQMMKHAPYAFKFTYWKNPPTWKVSSYSKCTVSARSPY